MTEFLQQFSFLELAAMAYMVLATVKIILVLSNVSVAAKVMQHKIGGDYHIGYYLGLVGLLCAIYTFFMMPILLVRERHKFFLCYTDEQVVSDVLAGL